MRRTINNIISVLFSFIKFSLLKLFHWNGFFFWPIERFSPNVVTEFNRDSKVSFGKKIRVHSGTKIKVRSGAELLIGDNVKINYYCIIACHDKIEIGEGTEFGPSVYVYDHDHDYKKGFSSKSDTEDFITGPIIIGKNCWIGAHTVILRGTTIGDNCIVGAGSVLKGQYANNCVIIQDKSEQIRTV